MLILTNTIAPLDEFRLLMKNTDAALNKYAATHPKYFKDRGGKKLETDVASALNECAQGTQFEGTIKLVSGASFPDIVAKKIYGVEVKSTEKNHWKSIGSSILESTRDKNVERIFLTFGKLGDPVQFLSRPYEECLSGITVTHYPRYQIDMCLEPGQTIFDELNIEYDVLRKMDDPVEPVAEYYRSKLGEGEKLWWARDIAESSPPIIRFWSNLPREERNQLIASGFAYFPEVINGDYNRFSMWLVTEKGIICPNVRDQFSAGGKKPITIEFKEIYMPAVYKNLLKYHIETLSFIQNTPEDVLYPHWRQKIKKDRASQWLDIAVNKIGDIVDGHDIYYVLSNILYPSHQ